MFVGDSDEERELAGEEMGWSLNPLAAVSAIKNIFTSPLTKNLAASGALGPQAALVARASMVAQGAKGVAKAAVPKGAAAAAKTAEPAAEEASALPAKAASATVGWAHDDDHIAALINRERDPEKRQRMIMSHERAKRMRTVSAGSGVSEVEDAIGELFARVPLDPNRQPYLDKPAVKALAHHMAGKAAGGATHNGVVRARMLIAQYTKLNNIATPGLKVVRR